MIGPKASFPADSACSDNVPKVPIVFGSFNGLDNSLHVASSSLQIAKCLEMREPQRVRMSLTFCLFYLLRDGWK